MEIFVSGKESLEKAEELFFNMLFFSFENE